MTPPLTLSYFDVFQTILRSQYLNVTDGRTDTRTDRRTDRWTDGQTYCGITVLCVASCGKSTSARKKHVNKTSETYRVCLVKSRSILREKISKVDERIELFRSSVCSRTLSCIHAHTFL